MAAEKFDFTSMDLTILDKVMHRMPMITRVIHPLRIEMSEIQDFLESDEAKGLYWWARSNETFFSDPHTAFAFKLRFG